MANLYSALHENIQDAFNEYGVQIMSPHYRGDPGEAKVVLRDDWHKAPAKPPAGKESKRDDGAAGRRRLKRGARLVGRGGGLTAKGGVGSTMEKVRLGMIGSRGAAHFHLSSLSKIRGLKVEVMAVASQKMENASIFAGKFSIPDAYDDYRRILDRKDIDVVDLCIPTDLHETFSLMLPRLENMSFVKNP